MVQHHQQQSPRAQVNTCTLFWQLGFRLGFKLAWLAVYRYKANVSGDSDIGGDSESRHKTLIVDVSGGPDSGSDVLSQGGIGYFVKTLLMPREEDDDTPAAKEKPRMKKRPRRNEDDHTEDHHLAPVASSPWSLLEDHREGTTETPRTCPKKPKTTKVGLPRPKVGRFAISCFWRETYM